MELTAVVVLSCLWQLSQALCVLEVGVGNLGMSVNCRFKKSSIVRVRNLGGIKGYIDLGLSLGDEMGFSPTFSQTEDRRRSTQAKRGSNITGLAGKKQQLPGWDGALRLLESPSRKTAGNSSTRVAATSHAFRTALLTATDHFQNQDVFSTNLPSLGYPMRVKKAPRKYYPLGYPEIPTDAATTAMLHYAPSRTEFRCDRQKYLPGLYADQQLGCRVFHACVDSGKGFAVSRSYSCPIYSLFDQTILRCNWWFYVDCKSSEKLYDSNIPVAKTYNLVKTIFFPIENET